MAIELVIRFSALQRSEIAEIWLRCGITSFVQGFSALQRAEIAEIHDLQHAYEHLVGFSALQRAEIAEIHRLQVCGSGHRVSVLFNEPKLLK